MSAAANLMGLVTQLQNMECAISSIIMESAMKLASLGTWYHLVNRALISKFVSLKRGFWIRAYGL